jgi:hypothetical protein
MPLHRDIYWVGRQWAVTGYGMQAIDQRLNGMLDIEVARLWEDGLSESMQGLKWLNIEDFNKGLFIARARYPEPPRKAAASQQRVSPSKDGGPMPQPKPAAEKFNMQIEGLPAKFVSPWHIRRQR